MIKKIITGKGGLVFLATLFTLIIGSGVASAQWALTNGLNSWDNGKLRWEGGNIALWLNTDPQAFYHEIVSSNQDEFDNNDVVNACGPSTSTDYAGTATIGLYHTDTAADSNAPGFQSTSGYQLVSCDLDVSGNDPDSETPNTVLATCTADNNDGIIDRCEIANQDTVVSCSTGNCQDEIATTVSINLDSNCDGVLDTGFDSDVCLYWTAVKPPNAAPFWQGNFQGRITDAGGDKTVSFTEYGPTAVTLQEMQAAAADSWQLPALLLLLVSFFTLLYFRRKHAA